jgi:hypothetical protein
MPQEKKAKTKVMSDNITKKTREAKEAKEAKIPLERSVAIQKIYKKTEY